MKKIGLLTLVISLCCSLNFSEESKTKPDQSYISDPLNPCKIFNQYPQKNETIRYTGGCTDGFAEGEGKVIWYKNNVIYQKALGTFIKGKLHGKATLYNKNGVKTYSGDFNNSIMSGHGTLFFSDGSKYVGQLKNHHPHGHGIRYLLNGAKYVGEFQKGQFHGHGSLFLQDGSSYVGDFVENGFSGYGTRQFSDNSKYVGDFAQGKFNGQGTLFRYNDRSYHGQFKDGKMNGKYTTVTPDGKNSVACFDDNKQINCNN